ncbi:T. brucei spp.-specific protein [Trypanosoma brucei gambiense DAL972]|uniref:Small RNA 2'-O-methyltransferase n=1 Tax=Trypanosoma brucei gambiense (strain MHOM/CI/86/DAL972) TaxID=679716 RepID=D0A575_TRYB9|nr:T. brucei spp.-specific protein [Trypanosoma brucei gambiense DAL972]CBH16419.1 T. brucei spp.-specific protein [Trypanosoma brucei gambiense DAL972]|eukprot:XP_011778683.1 T. brucei spp.-specific protein [Trypanosoma brucei gambiense DAL972]
MSVYGNGGDHEWTPSFSPPLYVQRAQKVQTLLRENGCSSFIDAGCSRGGLLRHILTSQLQEHSFSRALAIDLDKVALHEAKEAITALGFSSPVALLHPMHVEFVQGDLTKPPVFTPFQEDKEREREIGKEATQLGEAVPRTQLSHQYDAVISIEVLEHINVRDVPLFTEVLFAHLAAACGARVVVITTPNRDRNGIGNAKSSVTGQFGGSIQPRLNGAPHSLPGLPYNVRHEDHKFEMTAAQFRRYCDYVIEAYHPRWVSYTLFGVGEMFTQGSIFHAGPDRVAVRRQKVLPSLPVTLDALKETRFPLSQLSGVPPLTPSDAGGSEINWTHDMLARGRLFPWEEVFGELSTRPDEDMLCCIRTTSPYCSLPPVEMPYKPLWNRMGEAVRGAFAAAAIEDEAVQEHDSYLSFADVSVNYHYRFFAPFNASLCALISCMLRKVHRRNGIWNPNDRPARPLVRCSESASGYVRLVLAWILYDCWGVDALKRGVGDDSYGSARRTLSSDEMKVLLFLSSLGFFPGSVHHLRSVLHRGRLLTGSGRRRGVGGNRRAASATSVCSSEIDKANREKIRWLSYALFQHGVSARHIASCWNNVA